MAKPSPLVLPAITGKTDPMTDEGLKLIEHGFYMLDHFEESFRFALDEELLVTSFARSTSRDRTIGWRLGSRRNHETIMRQDGTKNATTKPTLMLYEPQGTNGFRLHLNEWPRLAKRMDTVPNDHLLTNALDAITYAREALTAFTTPAAQSDIDLAREALTAIAHEEGEHERLRFTKEGKYPAHLMPAILVESPTPWSEALIKLRFPHKGRDQRSRRKIARTTPLMIDLDLKNDELTLSPHRVIAPAQYDPILRLRILANLNRLAPKLTPTKRKSR